MTENEIQQLASKFLKGMTTKEEEARLHTWYESRGYPGEKIIVPSNGEQAEEVRDRLFAGIQDAKQNAPAPSTSWHKKWMSYAAAIFLILAVGAYLSLKKASKKTIHYTQLLKNDVGPGGNNAILESQNGEKINLDNAKIGDVVVMNGIKVNKTADGILAIEASATKTSSELQYHTIRTPRGGQYQLKLPDGTHVWLNASSSIRFPSLFPEDIRKIELNGEAYFEVVQAQNKKGQHIPFIVKTQQQQVEVLGTHFNINSYQDNDMVFTTLLEGSVRILPDGAPSGKLLLPGEQSSVKQGTLTVQPADKESVIAWKNGDFIFNQENLHSIMKKIERWYDVEIVYQGIDDHLTFTGAISRSKNLSNVLQIMEMTGRVSFKIEGRRVLVMT